jgi:hypothetical protein
MIKCKVILFVFLLLSFNNLFSGTYSGGNGSADNPYQLSTPTDLNELMNTTDDWVSGKYFIVTQNIDCSGYAGWSGGAPKPIGNENNKFEGNFDGDGNVISNFTISSPSTDVGFFGYLNGARVEGLGLEGVAVDGWDNTGGFCGRADNSFIQSCYCTEDLLPNNSLYIGGFCGYNYHSTIKYCYSESNIEDDVGNGGIMGGFCAKNDGGTIIYCYSTGNISNPYDAVGGFCSYNQNSAKIICCYSTGNVSAHFSASGFCYLNEYSSLISNCYATGNCTSEEVRSIGGFCCNNYYNSTIENCYYTGTPTSLNSEEVFGFVYQNFNSSILSCNYWQYNGVDLYDAYSIYGSGGVDLPDDQVKMITAAEFNDINIFSCFDFNGTWMMIEDYPVLREFMIPTLTEWAVILFIVLLAGVGGWFVWRRV